MAQRGYVNARFVEGELLVFGGAGRGRDNVTSGAELGFVWAVPGGCGEVEAWALVPLC